LSIFLAFGLGIKKSTLRRTGSSITLARSGRNFAMISAFHALAEVGLYTWPEEVIRGRG
jgi:hypothetical protein